MSEFSYKKLLDDLFDGVYYVDLNKHITFWNKGAERITGYKSSEVLNSCCADNLLRHIDEKGKELCLEGCPLSATMLDGVKREANVFLHHKMGHRVAVTVRTSPVRDDDGNVVGAVEIFSDNSDSIQILKELECLKKEAYLDLLTGVGNRRYGEMTLATRIYELEAHNVPFGIIFMDIDHFKQVNDNFGHKTGDDVLVMIAKSISNAMRKLDIVSRWGGEEFVLILPNINSEVLGLVAERVREMIEHSFMMVGDKKINVTASLGVTLGNKYDSAETVIKRADCLMYKSKQSGRNIVTKDF